jgi:hypothetical protein
MRVAAALAGRGHNGSVGVHGIRATKRATKSKTSNHRARTRLESVLGERRWRVLKNARADERRNDPDRVQRRDKTELQGGNGSRDQRHGLLIIARAGERHSAFMAGRLGIGVD